MSSRGDSIRCSAACADGSACRAWAMRGSDPPLCAAHSGRVGAPPGNKNAVRHGFYVRVERDLTRIEDVVADLADRQQELVSYIMGQLESESGDVQGMARLFALHGQNASRLGRLLRDKRALSGESADGILDAIGKALDEINTELGTEL